MSVELITHKAFTPQNLKGIIENFHQFPTNHVIPNRKSWIAEKTFHKKKTNLHHLKTMKNQTNDGLIEHSTKHTTGKNSW